MTTIGKLDPSAQGFVQSPVDATLSTDAFDHACGSPSSILATLRFGVVVLCSITLVRVLLKVLGKSFIMAQLCPAPECGCSRSQPDLSSGAVAPLLQ